MGIRSKEDRIRTLMRERRPADVAVSHYPPGEAPERFVAGDFTLHRATDTKGRQGATTTLGKLIQAGERRRFGNSDYIVVHVSASPQQRELACGFARTRVGDSYGIVNFIGLGVQALFGWTLSVHMDGQFICSGLVSRATEKYIEAYPRSPEDMMPGDLAYFWDASSGEPLPALGLLGRLLNLLVLFVDLFRRRRGDPAPDPGSR